MPPSRNTTARRVSHVEIKVEPRTPPRIKTAPADTSAVVTAPANPMPIVTAPSNSISTVTASANSIQATANTAPTFSEKCYRCTKHGLYCTKTDTGICQECTDAKLRCNADRRQPVPESNRLLFLLYQKAYEEIMPLANSSWNPPNSAIRAEWAKRYPDDVEIQALYAKHLNNKKEEAENKRKSSTSDAINALLQGKYSREEAQAKLDETMAKLKATQLLVKKLEAHIQCLQAVVDLEGASTASFS